MTHLTRVDEYLHAVPLSGATGEQIGPFTLFRTTTIWPYYARPLPGGSVVEQADVERVRERCAELDLPLSFEWVVETCPSLGPAAEAAGLTVVEYPLLVLERADFKPVETAARCEILPADVELLRQARAVANVGFSTPGTDVGEAGAAERDAHEVSDETAAALLERAEAGVSVTAAAFGDDGMLASGVHQPVGTASEIVGVATLPSARRQGLGAAVTSCLVEHALANGVELILLSAQNDAVAAVYERVGFHRIGHAGGAE
ncbi:GNAT family N-acetyltransferase [Kribbella lupini]|uniref:N-acetyltransferase domain-containing protein n=1 Tax=Kribbella lupini TaxID=291602 RepID=A0ABN2C2G6_9ACTN